MLTGAKNHIRQPAQTQFFMGFRGPKAHSNRRQKTIVCPTRTVIDYKTDRREKRNVAQVEVYAMALRRATGLPVRGIVLEV